MEDTVKLLASPSGEQTFQQGDVRCDILRHKSRDLPRDLNKYGDQKFESSDIFTAVTEMSSKIEKDNREISQLKQKTQYSDAHIEHCCCCSSRGVKSHGSQQKCSAPSKSRTLAYMLAGTLAFCYVMVTSFSVLQMVGLKVRVEELERDVRVLNRVGAQPSIQLQKYDNSDITDYRRRIRRSNTPSLNSLLGQPEEESISEELLRDPGPDGPHSIRELPLGRFVQTDSRSSRERRGVREEKYNSVDDEVGGAYDVDYNKLLPLMGPPGPPGPKGTRGYPGFPGPIGFDGPSGIKGQKGEPGEMRVMSNDKLFYDSQFGKRSVKVNDEAFGFAEINYKGLQYQFITIKGEPGSPGPPGSTGEKGSPGMPGFIGLTGLPGPGGPEGPRGLPGSIGSPGLRGIPGKKGDTGATGIQGAPGLKGDRGEAGSPGINGTLGPPGLPGPSCECTVDAISGQQIVGKPGPPGPVGPTGPEGAPGIKGDSGMKGDVGEPGMKGEKGSGGSIGLPGAMGPPGDIGAPGIIGLPGRDGQAGQNGLKGDRGENGTPGPEGPVGHTGKKGPKGISGKPGKRGKSGAKGEKGEQGIPGLDAPCPVGRDGLPLPGCGWKVPVQNVKT